MLKETIRTPFSEKSKCPFCESSKSIIVRLLYFTPAVRAKPRNFHFASGLNFCMKKMTYRTMYWSFDKYMELRSANSKGNTSNTFIVVIFFLFCLLLKYIEPKKGLLKSCSLSFCWVLYVKTQSVFLGCELLRGVLHLVLQLLNF